MSEERPPQPETGTVQPKSKPPSLNRSDQKSAGRKSDPFEVGKPSILANEEAFDVGHAAESEHGSGTIVTDKRRRRQSLFGAIKDAAVQWTGEKADTVKGLEVFQKPEAPKVQPGTKRKEVVEKAIAKEPVATREDDHRKVLERIRTYQKDAERVSGQPFVIKPKDPKKSRPRWTHILGKQEAPEQETAAAPASQKKATPVGRVVEDHVQQPTVHREQMTPEAGKETPAPEVAEHSGKTIADFAPTQTEPAPTRESVATQPEQAHIAPDVAKRSVPPPEPAPQPPQPVEPPPPQPQPRPTPVPQPMAAQPAPRPAPVPQAAQPQPVAPAPAPQRTGFGVWVFVATVIVLVVFGGGGSYVYFFVLKDESPQPTRTGPGTPITGTGGPAQADTQVTLAPPRETFLGDLRNTIHGASGQRMELSIALPADAAGSAVTAQDFFTLIEPRAPGSFQRTLQNIRIGGIRTNDMQPYLTFNVTSFDTAFAGMLEWEPFISADLAPLFGEPVARSFDATARTDDRTTVARFVDHAAGGYNIRVLYDGLGNERIAYTFIDRNTLIITTDIDALTALTGQF